ncbi:Ivy family c-type lysozyme inhibitor, partial [Burkholderia sp. SIMBA_013]
QRLIVAFSFDKKHAYAMLVDVPAGLPADKSPTRHANYRFLGKPDDGMQALLQEQLRKDPNWY